MSRRLLGPVGGPVMFFLIAALVFAGLGWVTVVALRVEAAQRETAAQAELGNNLRVALWRLDGRMLPALGVEDSRPFYHYASSDPLSGSTAGPTPLLAAPLPDWMKLHVQLDPVAGWTSPQVLAPDAQIRVSEAWPDLPLRNNTAERGAVLAALKDKYPAPVTCSLLAARDRAIPADAPPFATPLFDPPSAEPAAGVAQVPPIDSVPTLQLGINPPPVPAPVGKSSENFRLFGWELPCRDAVASNLRRDDSVGTKRDAPSATTPMPPPLPSAPPPAQKAASPQAGAQVSGGAGGRAGNYAAQNDNDPQMIAFRNRSGTISRGVQEAKNAGLDFPMYGKGQGLYPPAGNGLNNSSNSLNLYPGGPPASGQGPAAPAPPAGDKIERDGKAGAQADPPSDRAKKEAKDNKADEALRTFQANPYSDSFIGRIALALNRGPLGGNQQLDTIWKQVAGAAAPTAPRPVSAWDDRAQSNAQNVTNGLQNNLLTGPPAVSIHLGSMRPQWITAADGTETLVLVRAAKIDNATVYQGVVLDWVKLQQVLKEEVQDVFPGAALVPVKDAAGVSPDRAMTALPVQLDPGPAPALPPAGWTPLRFGLALAWGAALVAFAAVGLSGWSLIDLAERRIRFVSAVTHELRTPLTSLRLYLDLLMSGMIQDEAKRQEYLNTLATESDRLHRLIDNVLDFAKLEKRRANGDMKPVKVGELLEQLRATWTDRVGADGKELVVISTLPAELEFRTDAAMVQQIVGNLIDNARKYTRDADDKRIWLWAKPGGAARVVFEVEDRGAGVPASERKSIFKPFRRGTHADTRAGGAGLGLALAKQWAEVLGGLLAYRPAEGAPGSCFRLELPVK